MKPPVGLAVILCASTTLPAQQSIHDWRIVGATSGSTRAYVFYDANSVRKLPNGHLEVWLKAIPADDAYKAADELSRNQAYLDAVDKKMARGYVPPVALEQKLSKEDILIAVIKEEVANSADIQPIMRMLEEVDCENRVTRDVSLQQHIDGKDESVEKTGEWQHIAPETNMSRLHLAICR
jgi:hypothetical protein